MSMECRFDYFFVGLWFWVRGFTVDRGVIFFDVVV